MSVFTMRAVRRARMHGRKTENMGMIFYNGRILTLAAPFYAQAVLVEDGRIVSVGSEAQIRALAKPDDEWYDLNGKTLAPAFLDAHSHFSGYANSLMQIPLERAESFEDICAAIQNFVSTQSPGEGAWIVAKGYDHNRLREHRHPSLELLDKACPDHPLVVQHQSGHMGCVNSRALELLGIRPDTPAPEGGVIGLEGGKLTGYMEENAFIQALMKVPAPTAQDFLNAVQRAQERYASYGITTVQEGMLPSSALPYYDLILSREALWLDVVGYADVREREPGICAFPATRRSLSRSFSARRVQNVPGRFAAGKNGVAAHSVCRRRVRISRSHGRAGLRVCQGCGRTQVSASDSLQRRRRRGTAFARIQPCLCGTSVCAGSAPGYDPCAARGAGSASASARVRHDAEFLCGARVSLGRHTSEKPWPGARGKNQPGLAARCRRGFPSRSIRILR